MLNFDINRNILSGKTARKHFWFVPERESVGFSLDAVVFCQTRSVLQPEFILGKLMSGRLIKAPDQ